MELHTHSSQTLTRGFRGVEFCLFFAILLSFGSFGPNAYGDPSLVEPVDLRAESLELIKKSKWDDALVTLRTLQKVVPYASDVGLDLSAVMFQLGRREEALSTLLQYYEKEKSSAKKEALLGRLRVLSKQFYTGATQQAVQDGLRFLKAKKTKQARERFEKCLESEPDNLEILLRLAQAKVLDGDYESAIEHLRFSKKLNPEETQVRVWLGRALFLKGNAEEAVAEYKIGFDRLNVGMFSPEAIDRFSEQITLWYSEALRGMGSPSSAVRVLESNQRIYPSHVQVAIALAQIQLATFPPLDVDFLWNARRQLQIAQTKLKPYFNGEAKGGRFASEIRSNELGLVLERNEEEVGLEISRLLEKVQAGST